MIYGNRTAVQHATFGEPWYTDPGNLWRWRAIHSYRTGDLDYVWDRGGGSGSSPTSFIQEVTKSKELKAWSKEQSGSSSDVFTADDGAFHFRASNNSSYGYTYLWAWKDV